MELNLDGKGQPQPEQAIAKSARPSVLDRLKAPPVPVMGIKALELLTIQTQESIF